MSSTHLLEKDWITTPIAVYRVEQGKLVEKKRSEYEAWYRSLNRLQRILA